MTLEVLYEHITAPNSCTLDVGCGSGIILALVARLGRKNNGCVIGIEVIDDLVQMSMTNLKKDGFMINCMSEVSATIRSDNITVLHGDGWKGCPARAPFNAITVMFPMT